VREILFALLLFCASPLLHAAEFTVTVADPFLEMRTGPGRGYPVTNVAARGEQVTVIKRRTDWIKLRDARGREGWASASQMTETLTDSGQKLQINAPDREQFAAHRRELGAMAGDFEGANVISIYASYAFNPHLLAELHISHLLGNSSNGQLGTIGLAHVVRPDWRIQPFAAIGTGAIRIQPKASLVQTQDRNDQLAYVGLGAKAYLSRRFMLRFEYNKYVVFTNRDENEEPDEWKIGFAFFF
jgi:hypothetical protein